MVSWTLITQWKCPGVAVHFWGSTYSLENELGVSVCMRIHTHALSHIPFTLHSSAKSNHTERQAEHSLAE